MELLSFEQEDKLDDFDVGTAKVVPDNVIEQAQQEAERDEPTVGETWDAARRSESMTYALARNSLDSDYKADDNFKLADHFDEYSKEIPEEDWSIFEEARSVPHLDRITAQYNEEKADLETISNRGWQGTVMQVGAAIFDEGNAALVAAPVLGVTSKITKIQRALRVGGIAGVENAAIESFLYKSQHTRQAEDIVYAGLAGFVLGAPIGYLTRGESELMNEAARKSAEEVEGKAAKDFIEEQEGEHKSGGAAATGDAAPIQWREDKWNAEELNTPKATYGDIRYDMTGKLMNSDNASVRWAGSRLGEDAVGHYQQETASELASRLNAVASTKVHVISEKAFKDWIKDTKQPWHSRFTQRGKFFEDVSEAIRGGDITDPHISKVANAYRKGFQDMLQAGRAAGLKGFDEIPDNPNYLPRLHNQSKVRELNDKYGEGMYKLVEKAIKRAQPDLEDAVVKKISKGYYRTVTKMSHGSDLDMARPISTDSKDVIKQYLHAADVDPDEIDNILAGLNKATKNEGKISRAKHRTGMDESTTLVMKNNTTQKYEEVKLTDLFENNAERLFASYARQVSGHIGIAKKLGIKSNADWKSYKRHVEWGADQSSQTTGQRKADMKRLQRMYDLITGRSLEDDPTGLYAQTGRLARNYNFSRVMNQVGFAQLAEIGNLLSIGGFRATLRHIPEFKKMLTRLEDGELEDGLASELESLVALGTDRLRNPVHTRDDDLGFSSDGAMGKVDSFTQHANRFTADISGMAPITLTLQRMASKVVAQKFADMAVGGKGFSPQRLEALGINKADLDMISKQINKYSKTTDSMFGKKAPKLNKLNIDQWDDTVARDKFTAATYRMGRRIIQENDFGNTAGWMHSTTGKIVSQFRSFMLVAWQKQTLHNFAMRDWAAFSSFMTTTFFGGMAYSLQSYVNSVGRSDQQEYLAKRLNPETIAKQAFLRSGHASLIPAAIDTGWSGILGQDAQFKFGRSTGLESNIITGNPTYDLAINKGGAIAGLLSLPFDNVDYSKTHHRNIMGALPFQNATGVRNVLSAIGNDLPYKARND